MSKKLITRVWKNITQVRGELIKVGIDIDDVIIKEVGTRENTLFWHDRWNGYKTFKASFPEPYKLERHKYCKASDRIHPRGPNWDWKADISSAEQVIEAQTLSNRVRNIQQVTRNDRLVCKLSNDRVFRVDALRMTIDRRDMTPGETTITWTHDVPIKVNCLM